MTAPRFAVDALVGSAAPPLANGEPVFQNPTQARLFGMAHSLVHVGLFDWAQFRAALIKAIGAAEQGPQFDYYECFERALTELLAEHAQLDTRELQRRAQLLDAQASEHEHEHEHEHKHHHE